MYLAPAVLVASLATLFWRALFTSDMFYYRDVFHYSYPHLKFIYEALRAGFLPFWNPYLSYGEPLLVNPSYLFFYPTTLFAVVGMSAAYAYKLHYVLHFCLAAVGTYWLARRWEQSRWAAFFAAFIFTFSGPVLSLGNFYNHAAAAAWIPWALALTDRALKRDTRRSWIALIAVSAVQFLASEPMTWISTCILCGAYAFHQRGRFDKIFSRANGRILWKLSVCAAFVLALCAVVLVPALTLLENSQRGTTGLVYAEVTYWSLHPLYTLQTVLPGFFGEALNQPSLWMTVLNGRNAPYFPSLFIGFIPILFALLGWVGGPARLRGFAAGGCLSFFLLALGRFTPLFGLAYLLFPPLGMMRFPSKFLIPAFLLLALLAGWGVDAVRRGTLEWGRAPKRFYIPLGVVVSLMGIVWVLSWIVPGLISRPALGLLQEANSLYLQSSRDVLGTEELNTAANFLITRIRYLFPGLVGFILFGLVWVRGISQGRFKKLVPAVGLLGMALLAMENRKANPMVPEEFYSYRPPALDLMKGEPHSYRIFSIPEHLSEPAPTDPLRQFVKFENLDFTSRFSLTARVSFRERVLLERAIMLEGVQGSYNLDVERSFPRYLVELWLYARTLRERPDLMDNLLALTNVRYHISKQKRDHEGNRLLGELNDGSPRPAFLYENLSYAPRAYVAHRRFHTSDPRATLDRLTFDRPWTRSEVILFSLDSVDSPRRVEVPGEPPPAETAAEFKETIDSVAIVQYLPNSVTLEANLSRPGYVVLLDRYDPNFHATVDGNEVPIERANQLFRAVPVGPGEHTIRFFYRPEGLISGAVLSLLCLLVLVAGAVKRSSA